MERVHVRVWAGAVAAVCAVLLGTAATLHADPAGFGTHEQLGLPACPWREAHGMLCPTCGMTTAFTQAAHGHVLAAIQTQPAGGLGAMAAAMAIWVGLYVMLTGNTGGRFTRGWLRPGRTMLIVLSVIAVSWMYKLIVTGATGT
ncbi:MAG: DUF2752 domain-containing protein [Planctomycetes bacterium]|nr:DUF2752 domain-containing protein [Planctomycetota bacterium]